MHHLSRFLIHSKITGHPPMDPKKNRRRPKLERRNAAKDIDYDATLSYSSLDDSSSSSSLVTRSLDLSDRTSFRIEGTDGEFDRIFRSLGLSGPEDFEIPAAAWEAMKFRSASDLMPRSRLHEADSPRIAEEKTSQLCARVLDSVSTSDASELTRDESAELNAYCSVATCVAAGGGIKGVRPPLLKPPPSITLPEIDKACSTWDILRDFAPESDRACFVMSNKGFSSDDDDGEEERVGDVTAIKRHEEEETNLLRSLRIGYTGVLSESCSFTTSNDDDSSSTTTEPMSNISPNGRFRRIITYWEKGDLLGSGSFGSVYEGISE